MSDQPKLMKRRSITKAELIDICERQLDTVIGRKYDLDTLHQMRRHVQTSKRNDLVLWLSMRGFCDYSGEPLDRGKFDFDHKIPNALLYEGDKVEWQVILRKWHKVKTADDVARIAKAKRQAGEKGQYARRKKRGGSSIQSRGFQPKPEGYKYQWGKRGFGK